MAKLWVEVTLFDCNDRCSGRTSFLGRIQSSRQLSSLNKWLPTQNKIGFDYLRLRFLASNSEISAELVSKSPIASVLFKDRTNFGCGASSLQKIREDVCFWLKKKGKPMKIHPKNLHKGNNCQERNSWKWWVFWLSSFSI